MRSLIWLDRSLEEAVVVKEEKAQRKKNEHAIYQFTRDNVKTVLAQMEDEMEGMHWIF
jgi:hypothetical protein